MLQVKSLRQAMQQLVDLLFDFGQVRCGMDRFSGFGLRLG